MDDDEVQVPDRREVIEQAFEQAETAADTSAVSETPAPSTTDAVDTPVATPAPTAAPVADRPAAADGKGPSPAPPPDGQDFAVDKAPQAWRAPQKAKWATLDPDVRQEVVRREREITRALGETASARHFANEFVQTMQPYQARMQMIGNTPIEAVQALLKADYLLATAPKSQRARLMAGYIKDYEIDIEELDNALAGNLQAVDPVTDRVEQLVQQRLAPFQQFLQQHAENQQQQVRQTDAQISASIEAMSTNPKYEHFEALREDMADIVDVSAKRGVFLTLEQAYDRAVGMNPEVRNLVATRQATAARTTAATRANAQAQRALGASVSVSGTPSKVPTGAPVNGDRRATIEAAFESVEGR